MVIFFSPQSTCGMAQQLLCLPLYPCKRIELFQSSMATIKTILFLLNLGFNRSTIYSITVQVYDKLTNYKRRKPCCLNYFHQLHSPFSPIFCILLAFCHQIHTPLTVFTAHSMHAQMHTPTHSHAYKGRKIMGFPVLQSEPKAETPQHFASLHCDQHKKWVSGGGEGGSCLWGRKRKGLCHREFLVQKSVANFTVDKLQGGGRVEMQPVNKISPEVFLWKRNKTHWNTVSQFRSLQILGYNN